jgi:hypothetical protein
MNTYLIQAKVTVKVLGISGPFIHTVTKLVVSRSTNEATAKYEKHVRDLFSHMNPHEVEFEYLIVADTI